MIYRLIVLLISIFVFLGKANAQNTLALIHKIKSLENTDTINQFALFNNIKKELERNSEKGIKLVDLYSLHPKNLETIVYVNILKGQYHFTKSTDSAGFYFNEAKLIALKLNNKKLIAYSNMGQAAILLVRGDFDKSLKIYLDCLTAFDEVQDPYSVANLYNNIGSIFIQIENYEKAIEYYFAANVLYKKINDLNGIGLNYQKLGYISFNKFNFNAARRYFDTSFFYYNLNHDSIGIANIYLKYGDIEFEQNKNYNKALYYYNKANLMYQHVRSVSSQIFSAEAIAETYFKMGKIEQAELTILSAVKMANETGFRYKVPDLFLFLHDMYLERKDFENALRFYKTYNLYKDSIYINNKNLKIDELNIQYKTLEKDNELLKNRALINENEIVIQKQKTNIYVATLFLFLLVVLVVVIFYYMQKQKKLNNELTQLNSFKNNVFTVISHDLRSPVSSIVTHTNEPQTKAKAFTAINILDNLLNWTYPQLTKNQLMPIKIIFQEILEETLHQTAHLLDTKQQKIVVDINSDFVFTGDYNTTLIILRNLVSNASMYSDNNETIYIKQNGLQINIQNKCMLNPGKGLGIGMTLCNDLAKQNNYTLAFSINNNIANAYLYVL